MIVYVKQEGYTNFKSITVIPKNIVFDNVSINSYHKNSFYYELANKIDSIYPIYNNSVSIGSKTNLKRLLKNPNQLSIIQDDLYRDYTIKNPDNPIRFISVLGIEQFTLFFPKNSNVTNFYDIRKTKIGTLGVNTGSYFSLNNLNIRLNLNLEIIPLKESDILDNVENGNIDGVFMVTAHPSSIVSDINNVIPIKFISFDGIISDIQKRLFPHMEKSYIDLSHYGIYSKLSIQTLNVNVNLLCHKDFPSEYSYGLISALFSNFTRYKTDGSDTFKIKMKEYNPSHLYLSDTIYTPHTGVRKYYKKIGVITNYPNQNCVYSIGANKCTGKRLNFFRLI